MQASIARKFEDDAKAPQPVPMAQYQKDIEPLKQQVSDINFNIVVMRRLQQEQIELLKAMELNDG